MNPYLNFQHIAILGGGESGLGAAVLAVKHRLMPFLSDSGEIKPKYKAELEALGIDYEEMGHDEERILSAKIIIKSPGISQKNPLIVKARQKGIKVISEIEFASQFTDAKLIGITGTNGKTTTTSLTYHILKNAGFKVKAAGNIGNSFAREVANDEGEMDYYVLEISSFQLEDTEHMRLYLSVLLNLSPDHLDRYESLEDYIRAKLNIGKNQRPSDSFIYNIDDNLIVKYLPETPGEGTQVPFSHNSTLLNGAYMDQQHMNLLSDNEWMQFSVKDIALKGRHNRYNSMAAAIVAKALNVKKEVIRESLSSYKNVEHRLEHVARIKNVDYINDSKATNVNAAWYALESMENPTVWIAGGVDKGNDYSELAQLVRSKVKALICLGTDNEKLVESFKKMVPIILETNSMTEAVELAYKLAEREDNVLLAPACASFDLFENYVDRGNQFKRAVLGL
ncbi:MAG: UDP-N-acetylmuramoyl-L-alanine--D-glutamate ligase [Bacteroidetes bacterium]|jgi:UDP-N-acetylmuramoylalanine--D-glutamate ligase|nr:UDP-N-acetylmuramoyl-L-alanine--D-glutamate ligase [Bacteroidota bacterium]